MVRPREDHALGYHWESERGADGQVRPSLTLFLTGAECPFTCVFCDLWRYTIASNTAVGSIPGQIGRLLGDAIANGGGPTRPSDETGGEAEVTLKLYNASNFFDQRSVPSEDDGMVLERVAPFRRTTVESHPRLLGERYHRYAEALGDRLEVALGLETAHPTVFPLLNKGTTHRQLEEAIEDLRQRGTGVRLFVLVSPPFLAADHAVDWAVRSVEWGLERGAEHVTLIPTREGNGALETLRREGQFTPTTLEQLEEALERSLALGGKGVVTADLWDLARTQAKAPRLEERIARLERINLEGAVVEREIGRAR
ncbi:MAG: hypothetical protein K8J08_06115 [Thermoanaerobaculia bacterium]|nr:hypothetical protein [Thermoanaerobaculia bacterium]